MLQKHRAHLIGALTAVYGGADVFRFGFLIGRLTEPVPEMPAGIHGLAWLVLPLVVGAVVVPLATANLAAHRLSRPPVPPESLVFVQPKPLQWTKSVHGPGDVLNVDSALEHFPQEGSISLTGSGRMAHPDRIGAAS